MAELIKENIEKAEEKKKGFGAKFMNFLAMGGFFVIAIGALAIFILYSYLTK
jgi:prepilin signal peptidase PulO-like enzyme (type II secretory pathway)